MGPFVTRLSSEDRELQERLIEEARTCYATEVPMSVAISRLVELAGDNPNAFQGGGRGIRDLLGTQEGRAILRVIGLADLRRRDQNPAGVQRMVGQKRTPEEENLASMSIGDAFDLLAERDPRLREVAHDVVDAAETARTNGEDYSSVRHAVDTVVIRAIRIMGQSGTDQSALVSSDTTGQIVMSRLYQIADVRAIEVQSDVWPWGG